MDAIIKYLQNMGYDTVSADFYQHITDWVSWYQGDTAFHKYKVYNGESFKFCRRATLGMAKTVCEDWANLLMNEKVNITVSDDTTQKFLDAILASNNFWVKINEMQEMKSAYGTAAYIPYAANVGLSDDGRTLFGGIRNFINNIFSRKQPSLKIDYITADNIFPISWANGVISECAFASKKTIAGKHYVYLQTHTLDSADKYVISNTLFEENNGNITEVDNMRSVKGFENVASTIKTGFTDRQFVIDRLNITNNFDKSNPLGIAVFANAIDVLKGVDLIYDSYDNEFSLGKKRVIVSEEASKKLFGGMPTFDPDDVLFYRIPADSEDKKIIQEINGTLRTVDHETALQNRLNLLAKKGGFGENFYQFNRGNVTTATQIVSENSTLFRNLKKHEIILESSLIELVKIILNLGVNILRQPGIKEDVDINIDFDDSIIEDKGATKAQAQMEYQQGLIDEVEYHMKVYNLDEKTASEKVNKMNARRPKRPEASFSSIYEDSAS